MRHLHLVRHGPSSADPGAAACTWPLRPDASTAVARLAASGVLPDPARWFSSTEPKAVETARLLTETSIGFVEGLREAARTATWFDDPAEFEAVVRRSVQAPDEPAWPGWEPGADAAARVGGAVTRILASCPDDDIVLVGHGTAWTLLVAQLTGTAPDLDAWSRMSMPDHCRIDPGAREISSGWGSWRS